MASIWSIFMQEVFLTLISSWLVIVVGNFTKAFWPKEKKKRYTEVVLFPRKTLVYTTPELSEILSLCQHLISFARLYKGFHYSMISMNSPMQNEAKCITQHTLIFAVSKKLMGWLLWILYILFNLGEFSPGWTELKAPTLSKVFSSDSPNSWKWFLKWLNKTVIRIICIISR